MRVMHVAQVPPSVTVDSTVMDVVRMLARAGLGAAAVMDGDQLVGIISERDVMLRVVAERLDPDTTLVRDVMTSPVKTVPAETGTDETMAVMVSNHIRHVMIVNEQGSVVGIASFRNVYQAHVEDVENQLNTLHQYIATDCPGG